MNTIKDFLQLAHTTQESGGPLDSLIQQLGTLAVTGKTSLGLNHWAPSDKPRMEDFNRDNEILDRVITALKADKVNAGTPTRYDVAFTEIAVNAASSKYWKNPFGEVSVHLFLTAAAGQTIDPADKGSGYGAILGVLPEGFRPPEQVIAAASTRIGASRESAALHFLPDGMIRYTGRIVMPGEHIWGSISYLATL